jgi:hypothetical protein
VVRPSSGHHDDCEHEDVAQEKSKRDVVGGVTIPSHFKKAAAKPVCAIRLTSEPAEAHILDAERRVETAH